MNTPLPAELQALALRWQAERRPAVVVEITASRGSVPREAGTRMLVAADAVHGTLGGGHLELRAIRDARALLAETREALHVRPAAQPPAPRPSAGVSPAPPAALRQTVALGPALGQCCGGMLELAFTPLAQADPAAWSAPPPRFVLQLFGAGHVGRAIVALLAGIPCRVTWIDERAAEFPAAPLPPHIQALCVDAVEAEVEQAPPGCSFLVLTHSHDLDLALAHAILRRSVQRQDVAWFGLIGSRSKRARFEHRLAARGMPEAELQRMVCPIGVPGIAGKEPAVIAVAVVAQLLQHHGQAPALSAGRAAVAHLAGRT